MGNGIYRKVAGNADRKGAHRMIGNEAGNDRPYNGMCR
jgi:hypothetical protein